MTFPITIAPLVRFKVEGNFSGETGEAIPFEFHLTCERLGDQAAVDKFHADIAEHATKGSTTPITDALLSRVKGWALKDAATNQDVPFSDTALRGVLDRQGVSQLAYSGLVRESGAKAKNS
jgi:hypothetical protein